MAHLSMPQICKFGRFFAIFSNLCAILRVVASIGMWYTVWLLVTLQLSVLPLLVVSRAKLPFYLLLKRIQRGVFWVLLRVFVIF